MTQLANLLHALITTACITGLVVSAPFGLGLRSVSQAEHEQAPAPAEELGHHSPFDTTRNSVELYRRQCCRGSKIRPNSAVTAATRRQSTAPAVPTCATQSDIYSLPLRC